MGEERRGHNRESLDVDGISAHFSIEVEGQSIDFNQVNDVSISGMGLILSQSFSIDTPVALKFVSDEFDLRVAARVAWCEPDGENEFRVGVQFSADDLDANVMFFMTLREFIDDFGEAF